MRGQKTDKKSTVSMFFPVFDWKMTGNRSSRVKKSSKKLEISSSDVPKYMTIIELGNHNPSTKSFRVMSCALNICNNVKIVKFLPISKHQYCFLLNKMFV